jgi:hypothetical protein
VNRAARLGDPCPLSRVISQFVQLNDTVLAGLVCCLLAGCAGAQIAAAQESYSHGKLESAERITRAATREAPGGAALTSATAYLDELHPLGNFTCSR